MGAFADEFFTWFWVHRLKNPGVDDGSFGFIAMVSLRLFAGKCRIGRFGVS